MKPDADKIKLPLSESIHPLPETDGWDKDARAHPKIRIIHLIFVMVAILSIGVGGSYAYRYKVELDGDRTLTELTMDNATDKDLRRIAWRHRNLESLRINDCSGIANYALLDKLDKLNDLQLINCPKLTDLPPMENLTSLHISDCLNLTDLSPLKNLNDVWVTNCPKLTGLHPKNNLTFLSLVNCKKFTDLPPMEELNTLQIQDCPNLSDLTPLNNSTMLTSVFIGNCPKITQAHLNQLGAVLPNCFFSKPRNYDCRY